MKTLKELFGGFNKDKPAVEEVKVMTPFTAIKKQPSVPNQAKVFKVNPVDLDMYIGIDHEKDWEDTDTHALAKESWHQALMGFINQEGSLNDDPVDLNDIIAIARDIFFGSVAAQLALDQIKASLTFNYVSDQILEAYFTALEKNKTYFSEEKKVEKSKTAPKTTLKSEV